MGAECAPNPYSCPWFTGTRGDTLDGVNLRRSGHAIRSVPVPTNRDSGRSGPNRPSLAIRIRTRFRRAKLDKALATGVDPGGGGAELALRAEQLSSPGERARIANALVEALGDARRGEPMTIRPRPQRAVVRDAADDTLALVLRLRDDRPVGIAGVAAAARLVDDRTGPM